MSDIFVSYKRENLAAVGRLVEALRAESVDVWWDQDIPPNAPWEATIEKALAAAKLVVVAWSPASVASENVKAEARWARAQGRLLQVFVEACEPPLFFGERQGVDFKGWSGHASDPAFQTLLQAVRAGPTRPSDEIASAVSPTAAPASLPLPTKPSIAVLPFADMTGSEGQDYFVDGMVEEITAALSRVRSIFVIASSSALTFKGKGVGAQDAARQLGVRYVLEGSVRKAAGRVRIAVQLIDANDGVQIWTQRFEDTLEDVFALQDRVALAVAGQIEPTVQAAEIRRASARPTENISSYDLYLRALPPWRTNSMAGYIEARDLAYRAIALDPDYGLALGLAASCTWLIVAFGWSEDPEGDTRRGIELAHRALHAASDDTFVLDVAALVAVYLERDLGAGITLVDQAIALNPGSAVTWMLSGALRLITGDLDLAAEHIERSLRLDPMGPDRAAQMFNLGNVRLFQRRFGEAVSHYREMVQRAPDNPAGYTSLAAAYGHLGQTSEARAALARFGTLSTLAPADFTRMWSPFLTPEQLQLYLEGFALAEGSGETDTAAAGAP
jgi:adenylate cyclase